MATHKPTDPREVLHLFVAKFPTNAAAARMIGISGQYLGDLMNGRRTFSDRVLNALGLQRIVVKKAA